MRSQFSFDAGIEQGYGEEVNEDSFSAKKARSIALYTAQLSNKEEQVEVYADFLSCIHGTRSESERRLYWEYAQEANMNQNQISARVYELQSAARNNTDEIEALKYLCYDIRQRGEALLRANELLCRYLMNNQLSEANQIVNILPEDTIAVVLASGPADLQACRDNFCLELYLAAQNQFTLWKTSKTQIRSMVIGDVASAVSRDSIEREISQYSGQFREIALMALQFPPNKLSSFGSSGHKFESLLPLLSQPGCQPGWLSVEYGEEDTSSQMRQYGTGKLVFQLEEVLSAGGFSQDVVQMAEWISDELWKIYNNLTPEQLQLLLERIRIASLAILQSSQDPLGLRML